MERILLDKETGEATGLSRTTRWRLEKAGQFPCRVNVSPGRIGWLESEVEEWIKARPRTTTTGLRGQADQRQV